MKKIFKLLIVLFIVSFSYNVHAITIGDTYSYQKGHVYDSSNSSSNGWNNYYQFNGKMGYCIDPGYAISKNIQLDHVLASTNNEATNAIEYGILYILNNSTEFNYYQITSAVRLYYCSYLGLCRNNSNGTMNHYNSLKSACESGSSSDICKVVKKAVKAMQNYDSSKNRIHINAKKVYSETKDGKRYVIVRIEASSFSSFSSYSHYFKITGVSGSNIEGDIKFSDEYSTDFSKYTESLLNTDISSTGSYGSKYTYVLLTLNTTKDDSTFTFKYSYYDLFYTRGLFMVSSGSDLTFDYDSCIVGSENVDEACNTISGSSSMSDVGQRYIVDNYGVEVTGSFDVKDGEDACKPTLTMPSLCEDDSSKVTVDADGYVTYKFSEGVKNDIEDINKCILGNTDVQGNSYLQKKVNDYCSIYCKEDYEIYMPYKIDNVAAGRYFQLNVKIKATQSCYMQIDYDKYSTELDTFNSAYNSAVATEKSDLEKAYNTCKNYSSVTYDFNPTIKYDYNEPIGGTKWVNDDINKMVLVSSTKNDCKKMYCKDSSFSDCSSSYSESLYVKWVCGYDQTYTTPRVFYTLHSYNKIVVSKTKLANADLIDGLPVSSNTPGGTYPYKIILEDFGNYYGTSSKGRIFSSSNSTSEKVKSEDTYNFSQSITTTVKSNEYVCTYNVPSYDPPDEHCPECDIKCVGPCLYDSDKSGNKTLHIDFRTISEGNINPNGRSMGYNWNIKNAENVLVARKAKNTITEIEENASKSASDLDSEDNNYTLKVTLTPTMISEIRSYNDSVEKSGGYSNETTPDGSDAIYCSNYNVSAYDGDESTCKSKGYTFDDTDKKCYVQNIFCYSKFIDDLITNHPENVSAPNRDTAKTKAFRKVEDIDDTLTNDYWTITVFDYLDVNSDGIPDIGPSWK